MSEPIQSFREFLRELRRRSVYKVAVAYLVAGFVVVQLADLASGAFGLPSWFEPMVWVVCGLGFPLALILAWAFEVTPEGMRRTQDGDRETPSDRGGAGLAVSDVRGSPSSASGTRRERPGAPRTTGPRGSGSAQSHQETARQRSRERSRSEWLADRRNWVVLGIMVLLLAGLLWTALGSTTSVTSESKPLSQAPVLRFRLDSTFRYLPSSGPFDVSPDGSEVVYQPGSVGADAELLIVFGLDGSEPRALPGTDGGISPLFSSDGRWIAYSDGEGIYRVPVDGGTPQPMLETEGGVLSAWDSTGMLYYSNGSGSYRLPPGAEPEEILSEGFSDARWVRPLPGGDAVIFTRHEAGSLQADVAVLNLRDSTLTTVVEDGFDAFYSPTGHLVYARFDRSLVAVPFDADRLEVVGSPIPLLGSLALAAQVAYASFDTSPAGTAIFASDSLAQAVGGDRRIALVDENGQVELLPLPPGYIRDVSVSSDGRSLAYTRDDELRLFDLVVGSDRLLDSGRVFINPVWSSDGSSLVYGASLGGGNSFTVLDVVNQKQRRTVSTEPVGDLVVESWHPDGQRLLAAADLGQGPTSDLAIVNVEDGTTVPYLDAPWQELYSSFSPDGAWVAYNSDENGTDVGQVFVRSFPEPGAQIPVSGGLGTAPRWSPDGSTIYYLTEDSVHAAEFRSNPRPAVTARRTLFARDRTEGRLAERATGSGGPFVYDVHPDGGFVMLLRPGEEEGSGEDDGSDEVQVHVVTNWFRELQERMGERSPSG